MAELQEMLAMELSESEICGFYAHMDFLGKKCK